jgi:hypothetical protein
MFSICYKEVVMPGKITVSLQVAVAALLISAPTIQAGAIHDAVKSGDMQNVKTLIDGANELLNAQDEDGKTPLHHAVRTGNGEIARYLIERGADINLTDTENESPLHYAASSGNLDMAKLLLEKGATSLNAPTLVKYGGSVGKWTPLHYACGSGCEYQRAGDQRIFGAPVGGQEQVRRDGRLSDRKERADTGEHAVAGASDGSREQLGPAV